MQENTTDYHQSVLPAGLGSTDGRVRAQRSSEVPASIPGDDISKSLKLHTRNSGLQGMDGAGPQTVRGGITSSACGVQRTEHYTSMTGNITDHHKMTGNNNIKLKVKPTDTHAYMGQNCKFFFWVKWSMKMRMNKPIFYPVNFIHLRLYQCFPSEIAYSQFSTK